nr:MATE family efflux transporter [Paracandidimonas lactea]
MAGHIAETLRQAWPVLISSWASIVFGVMDTAMSGHASAADLQAMALSGSIYITVFVGLMGVVHALIPIIAQHFGAGRHDDVGHAWGQGVWLAGALSAAGVLAMLFPDIWLAFSGDIAPQVRTSISWYLRALAVALPATLLFRTIHALGSAVSRPKMVMHINLASVAVKLLLNWVFIFGNLGAPALGAVGAGVATAIVGWMMLAAGLWAVHRDPYFRRFNLRVGQPNAVAQKELLRLGLPMGGSYLIEVCAFTFMALLVAREGMIVNGGHQIMANLAALCYMMPMAVGVASASLTAQAIGARDFMRARATGRAGLVIVITGAALTATVLVVAKRPILGMYTDDVQVALVAAALLQLLPWFHLCDAMQCINSYLLRAYKVAVVPLILQILALTGIGLVGGWWLGFGPGAGALAPMLRLIAPGAPPGAGAMWTMAMLGLGLSATLLFGWYQYIVRRHRAI